MIIFSNIKNIRVYPCPPSFLDFKCGRRVCLSVADVFNPVFFLRGINEVKKYKHFNTRTRWYVNT